MVWHDYPSIHSGGTLPALNILKHLSKENEITLLCFVQAAGESKQLENLEQYCETIETVDILMPRPFPYQLLGAIRNTLSPQNLLARNRCFLTLCYSAEMLRKFKSLLSRNKFDLIYTSFGVAYLSRNARLPKVVHGYDCVTRGYYERYKDTSRLMPKIFRWLAYLQAKRTEAMICNKFDACIVVAEHEKSELRALFPTADVRVIPNGVDCEYFEPKNEDETSPSVAFVGSMSDLHNVEAVLYFYRHIYGYIKREIPGVGFYVIGHQPAREIQLLTSDKTIIVTGYVDDIRPYLARTSVVVVPMISGRGVKNKVLESMSMGKAVVTTSIGARGIDVTSDENIIVADEPMAFAQRVVELFKNEEMRREIGLNARKLVEAQYSWAKAADNMYRLFREKVAKNASS